jgi:murein DD-endopeptidase MepM/ murein hydrolase activator NlpD
MVLVALLTLLVDSSLAQAPVTAQPACAQQPSTGQGRAYVRALLKGDVKSVAAASRGWSADAVAKFSANLRGFGTETRVISESLSQRDGVTVYKRMMAVSNYARGIKVEVSMDELGHVVNLGIDLAREAAPTAAGAYRTLAPLRLPVEGAWYVLWGGRTFDDNKHASVSDMRYALDLLQTKGAGSFTGRGVRNEDYFAWGQPVVAPGGGTVVVAVDDVVDNVPNHPVGGNLYGNFIVVDHGTGEFSLLAHLQQHSVRVKVGEVVSPGQPLARVGSSGMSTEPHLHYHLMDNADWRKAQGLPAQFTLFSRNGQLVERAEPRRGETIAPAAVEARR